MINIYVIRSEHLQNRWKSIDMTINKIVNLIQSQKMKYSVINITSPSVEDIEKNIADYNNQINLTEEIEDEDFKKLQSKFNLAQLSNLLKHKKAYDFIKKSNNKHNLIIEDDVLLPDDHNENFINFLKLLNMIEYDILFTCISNNNEKSPAILHFLASSKNLASRTNPLHLGLCAKRANLCAYSSASCNSTTSTVVSKTFPGIPLYPFV